MSSNYEMGEFVTNYLQSIGLDLLTIGEAICDENLQKSLRAGAEKLSKQSFSAENMAKMYTKLYKSMLSTEKG